MAVILRAWCYKAARRYACASFGQYLASSSPTYSHGTFPAYAVRWIPATLRGSGFHRSVEFTVPALRWPVNSFFQDSEKIFSEPRQGIKPCQLGMDTIRKSFVPETARHVKQFFKFFSHFYLQSFQVLMHMPRIFFKSSMILASYVSFFVLNCNARAYMCGHVWENVLLPQNGTEIALESLKGLFPYHGLAFPVSWLIRPFLRHFGAYGAFRRA